MFFVLLSLFFCITASQSALIHNCGMNTNVLAQESALLQIGCRNDLDTLTWEIRPWRDQPSLEIVCNYTHNQCSDSSPEVTVDRFRRRVYLTISKVERAMFNSSTISCNTTSRYQDRHHESSCLIDVVYYADVKSCDVEVHKPYWTLNGSCDVTKVFSSAGNYSYKIYENYNKTRYTLTTAGTVNDTSSASSLTSFTETSSGNVYHRGRLPFSLSIPSKVGNVTYSVLVTPGTDNDMKDINKTVIIEPPGDPLLANCGQRVFVEGGNSSDTPCVCTVTTLGSPSGRLQWVADDVVLVSGEYGVTQLVFPNEKLTRTHNGMNMRCQVDWVVTKNTTSFTQHIFYGPDRADIVLLKSMNHTDTDNVTLLCGPLDVNPASLVLITWGGLCQGQQGRMCTLAPPIDEHCGKDVTCTATNQKIPGKQATSRRTVNLHSCTAQRLSTAGSVWKGVGIGVGVTLVVVLVVGVMLGVLWRRRLLPACLCGVPTYDAPSKKRQKEEEEQRNYTDISIYEPAVGVSRPSTGAANPKLGRTREEMSEGAYVNTAAL